MSGRVLIDTDIFIDVGRNESQAIEFLQLMEERLSVSLSAVTQMELIIGCQNKTELRKLDHFLKRYEIVKINESISETAVELLRQYRLSHGLLIADALIAATAKYLGEPLASKNQRDYRFIEKVELLPYP
jgi:predicted nucleic acid-binding protein